MTKPANKLRGEVAVPALGDGVIIRFNVDSLERLESAYKEKWLDLVLEGLADSRISTIKTCLEVSVIGDVPIDFAEMRDLDAVRACIYDALFLMLYGKTFEEKREAEEMAQIEGTKKRLQQMSEDPHLAALLFSQQFGPQATEPDSDLMKSAA